MSMGGRNFCGKRPDAEIRIRRDDLRDIADGCFNNRELKKHSR